MEKLKINFQNCYGIKKLDYEFAFLDKNTFCIYASNGVMKSSFAKTFSDLQEGKLPQDRMFPDRETKYQILDESGNNIKKEDIFVIHPYLDNFESENISLLLLKDSLKKKYEIEYKKIIDSEKALLEKLKSSSGCKDINTVKQEIIESFMEKDFFDVIETQEPKVLDGSPPLYQEIIYTEIFNSKSYAFLKSEEKLIKEYIERYDKLVAGSNILGKDFNHYRAKKTSENLGKMGFFKGGHKVRLVNKQSGSFEDFTDTLSLKTKIAEEEKVIFKDEKIGEILQKLDKKIKNAELERLRDYLFSNKHILKELKEINIFRKKIWVDYFKENIDEYKELLEKIRIGKKEIETILIEARGDKEQWKKAIEEFNNRFIVPFKVDVNNIDDVLTKNKKPIIDFIFIDEDVNMCFTGQK